MKTRTGWMDTTIMRLLLDSRAGKVAVFSFLFPLPSPFSTSILVVLTSFLFSLPLIMIAFLFVCPFILFPLRILSEARKMNVPRARRKPSMVIDGFSNSMAAFNSLPVYVCVCVRDCRVQPDCTYLFLYSFSVDGF